MNDRERWWAVLADRPDDLDALAVAADLLVERGNDHGTLVRLEVEGRRSGRRGSTVEIEQRRRLIASELQIELGAEDWWVGFVRSARGRLAATLERCLAHSAFRVVRWLEWSFAPGEDLEAAFRALPSSLHELRLTGATAMGRSRLPFLPQLRVLLSNLPLDLAGACAPLLRHLSHHPVGLEPSTMFEGLGQCELPELHELLTTLPSTTAPFPAAFLERRTMPTLDRLVIAGALSDEQFDALASSALLAGLKAFHLKVPFRERLHELAKRHQARFAHLSRLEFPMPEEDEPA